MSIIEKLENLNGQDWEVNLDIMKFMGFAENNDIVSGNKFGPPSARHTHSINNYTGSIDKALELIPNGWGMISLEKWYDEWICKITEGEEQYIEYQCTNSHKIAAIAILITIFKLKEYLVEK
ncbi:MAG: hypothetical protein H8D97_01770 [Proteobacteria bacterium]|nr:hypothetical protein [Pseudomonadota bacterium]